MCNMRKSELKYSQLLFNSTSQCGENVEIRRVTIHISSVAMHWGIFSGFCQVIGHLDCQELNTRINFKQSTYCINLEMLLFISISPSES